MPLHILARLFGRALQREAADPHGTELGAPSTQAAHAALSPMQVRRGLLRNALRDTLHRHGIPEHWITAESLAAKSRDGRAGLHWRLAIRHWDPRLPLCCVALQNSLLRRLHDADPVAESWLHGLSWQFALEDESGCPGMPHPGAWTAMPRGGSAVAPAPVAGGLIEGPVHLGGQASGRFDALDQLLDAMDKDNRARSHAAEQTQPMYIATRPMELGDRPQCPPDQGR